MAARLLWLAAGALPAAAQFGGPGGGWTPPPPACPSFTCPAKQKPVAREGAKVWAYGCKESGVNFLNMASFNPNDPLSGMQGQKSVDKCCVEKEICLRTCGMPAVACHEHFQKCSKKVCKGDQNCNMMAQLADIMSTPLEDEYGKANSTEGDRKCSAYNQAQKDVCECVPKDQWQDQVEARLKSFYQKHKPEKLDKKGEIKDKKSIWKQWKGKEPEMFFELTKKYREKAVEIRVKPKPKYDKGPGADAAADSAAGEEDAEGPGGSPGDGPADAEATEEDDGGFKAKLLDLQARKEKAVEAEDYDLADQLKEELGELKRAEVKRLRSEKSAAIEMEDFITAKKLKRQLDELDPKSEL